MKSKLFIFTLMILVIFTSVSVVYADDNATLTACDEIEDVISLSDSDAISSDESEAIITDDNYAQYFSSVDGKLVSSKVNSGDILLRIETAGSEVDGHYWDKVVLPNGEKGYIARDFVTQIDDVSNVNTSAVANVNVNLRNGPGTSNTTVIRTLTSGQSVTIIESNKYNGLDGYNWSRIKLSNGAQGYLVSDYLTETAQATNYQMAYVNCNPDGKVYVRSGVGTGHSIVTALVKDTKVTVKHLIEGDYNRVSLEEIN